MVTLGIDSTAKSASAAVVRGGVLLSEHFLNVGLTHSVTLLKLCEQAVESAGLTFGDLDCVAVNAGPGSFTGVRIGVALAKGLAFARDLPCVPVRTTACIARPIQAPGGVVAAAMDARCGQVYTALFETVDGESRRLTPDEAIPIEALGEKLKAYPYAIVAGDGAALVVETLADAHDRLILAPESVRHQRAGATALIGERDFAEKAVSAEALVPFYIRPPQAQRMLQKKPKTIS